jgi:hypothetical protein
MLSVAILQRVPVNVALDAKAIINKPKTTVTPIIPYMPNLVRDIPKLNKGAEIENNTGVANCSKGELVMINLLCATYDVIYPSPFYFYI